MCGTPRVLICSYSEVCILFRINSYSFSQIISDALIFLRFILQSAFHGDGSDEDIQHHPSRHRRYHVSAIPNQSDGDSTHS